MSEKIKVTYKNTDTNTLTFENGNQPVEIQVEPEEAFLLNLLLSQEPKIKDEIATHQTKSHEAQDYLWNRTRATAKLDQTIASLQQTLLTGLGWDLDSETTPPLSIQTEEFSIPSGLTSWEITKLTIDNSKVEFNQKK